MKSPYVVKADLSQAERATESHLLKVWWSLIQASAPKSDIKICGNKLYVKGKLYGEADRKGFRLSEPESNTNASVSNVVPSMDTSSNSTF